jgi:hypothetical protein
VVKNPEILKQVFKDDRSFFSYVQFIPDVVDRVVLNKIKLSKIAQPGGKNTFDPKADAVKPEPRYGYVEKCKVDLAFDEEDMDALWKSYLGELENRNPEKINDLPYQKVFIELILAQLKEDDQLEALYRGVRNAAGTEPADMYHGFLKIIADDIAANIIKGNQIVDQAALVITPANALDAIEAVKALVPDRFRMRDMVCIISPTLMDYYNQDYRSTHGALPYNTGFAKQAIDGTNIKFEVEEGLQGSQRIIITPRYNFKYMAAGNGDMSRLTFQEFNRELKMLGDWRAGVNYAFPEYIWQNNRA